MTSHFSLLFSITIEHTYYADGICQDLVYMPSLATQRLMNKYGLLLQKTPLGFSFYATTDQTIKDFLDYLTTTDNETSFTFDVTSLDPYFTVFTSYPISKTGIFSFNSSEVSSEGEVSVLNAKFTPVNTATISFSITIGYDAIIRFRESGNNPDYKIKFDAQKTQWRYYIINKSNLHFEKLEIQSDSDIQFEGPTEVTLPNNEKALLFSSGTLKLPISRKVIHRFNLIGTTTNLGNPRTQTIINGLPIASTTVETYTEGDITQLASPLYIYI
ncbi:hypothetical protein GCM10011344_35440 [Dokdonia pacifica]|uniref:Uncharacterized protein n=1 Tax=Dokdonia pacifica TaxID=1627892 RepID=A0A239ATF9_9FLAO|nr:hypothetical protein [Dokdonia pacifica]GGG31409.1 hypothetical protein GCM10011344_35440 [Dokdonia pacifica]SNR98258.1 hypothetical protein SAMN06265376_10590 [Dokdonia pacifica]